MRSSIAVGISDPAASRDALGWAMARATRTESEVVLVHVVDDSGPPGDGAGSRMLDEELRTAEAMAPSSSVRVRRLHGSVMWQLVAASDDFGLVVVGTHRTGFIHGTVFGSTTLALAASAACPVVVVPAPAIADPDGVVVGADDSVAGLAALAFAAAEAEGAGQTLVIVRATDRDALPDADPLLERLREVALAAHPALEVRVRLLQGSAAEVLIAASAGARLLVLGDSRTGSSAPPALGAVCHDALLNIRVPTAIVHSADSTGSDAGTRSAAWLRSVRAASGGVRPAPPGPPAPDRIGVFRPYRRDEGWAMLTRGVERSGTSEPTAPGVRSNGAVAPRRSAPAR